MSGNRIDTYLTYLLARAHRRLHSGLEAELHKDELTVEQWRVLEVLGDREGRSMGMLAELVLMNHPALTKMADRMVVNGLIHRAPDPQDQRRVLVYVTDRGAAIYERAKRRIDAYELQLESALGKSKSAALRALLEDLIAEKEEVTV